MKEKFLIILGLGLFFLCNKKVEAAELRDISNEEQQLGFFAYLDEDDKLLQLPDGSFLKGEATISSGMSRSSEELHYNSDTDPNSISFNQFKEIFNEQSNEYNFNSVSDSSIMGRRIIADFRVITLKYKDLIIQFVPNNRVGWTCMPAVYQSASSTGPYLIYGSKSDSALIGTGQQAVSTLTGRVSGTFIGANTERYYTGTKTMYSYVPQITGINQSLYVANY